MGSPAGITHLDGVPGMSGQNQKALLISEVDFAFHTLVFINFMSLAPNAIPSLPW